MPQNDEQWPGKVEPYRDLLAEAEQAQTAGDQASYVGLTIAAEIAGLSQILDKIAYAARSRQ